MSAAPAPGALLVVDDEIEALRALERELRPVCVVHPARSAAEALQVLRQHPIQVVLSDQRMAGLTGTQLLEIVRREFPDRIRLLFTAYADVRAVIEAINVGGVYRYLPKPWDRDALALTIREAFERHRLEEESRGLLAELSRKNRELEVRDGLRQEFVAMAAHDVRNMLGVVKGFSGVLVARSEGAEARCARRIDESASSVVQILDDLLGATVIERGDLRLDARDTDLVALVSRVVGWCEPVAEEGRARMTIEVSAAPPLVPCDPARIERVLGNLLHNALKFSPPDTAVRVGVERCADSVRVTVTDHGVGIQPADLPKVFSKYWCASSSTRGVRGVGLGLAICKIFVERHGGTIGVESEPGHGATFWFTLPLARAP
jgi:signal transduction histidine kinase